MKKKKKSKDKSILAVTYMVLAVFAALMAYLLYYVLVLAPDVINNPYNKRQSVLEKRIERGSILSADGSVLACTRYDEDGNSYRYYPYANMFSHIVGYTYKGGYGLESYAGYYMLNSNQNLFEQLLNDLSQKKSPGDDVVTTFDAALQKKAYDAMGKNNGAVIISEPSTGKILAMVSKPDFDPNTLAERWDRYVSQNESVLVNRALQGLYTPGSTFKIITLLEYVRENPLSYMDYRFTCTGSCTIDNTDIHCLLETAHGEENLLYSLANSCNTSFVNIGLTLNIPKFNELCNQMLFNSNLPIDLEYNKSSFSLAEDAGSFTVAQTSFGQGATVMTPIHMSLIMNAIANDGVVMKPMFLDQIVSSDGNVVKSFRSEAYTSIMTKEEAALLKDYLAQVAVIRYEWIFEGVNYTVSGKTGTAEHGGSEYSHSLFVSFAPSDEPEISVVVVLEGDENQDNTAVQVAKDIYDFYFSRNSN